MDKSNLEQKHLIENNRQVFIGVVILQALAIVSAILFKNTRIPMINVLSLLGSVIGIIVSIIGRVRFVNSPNGHKLILGGASVSYLVMMSTNPKTPYVFGFTFLLCFIIMFYRDISICKFGVAISLIGNIIFTVEYILDGVMDRIIQVISDDLMVILGCAIAYLAVKQMNSQNNEILNQVHDQANEASAKADLIKEKTDEIKELLSNANGNVETLSASISSSAEAMRNISDSTNSNADSIKTQNELSAGITDALSNVSKKTVEITEASDSAKMVIITGSQTVESLKVQSQHVADANQATAKITDELQERAAGIKDVINTILSISTKTNLLSLNASIEAARAGEAGRGFAVVADEIRQLSDTTKDSAQQIADVIEQLVEIISNASQNMQQTLDATAKEAELIISTSGAFEDIKQSVDILSRAVVEIEKYVKESTNANEKVQNSLITLASSSDEVVESANNSLELSEACDNLMIETKGILDKIFSLSETL